MIASKLFKKKYTLFNTLFRSYRLERPNPYISSEVKVTKAEIEEQKELPVWERMFDHKKYMEHEGALKMTTGLSMVDVEPFPRLKLMKLYYMTLDEIRDIPDSYNYKAVVEEVTKYRMEVVDTNKNVRDIEKKIAYGMVEELIIQAHNELKLMKLVKQYKPWEYLKDYEDVNAKEQILSLSKSNIFGTPVENFQHDKNTAPPRWKPTQNKEN